MAQDPFSVLQGLEQAGTAGAPLLFDDSKLAVLWSGVAFRLGDLNLVTPLDHVLEVLPYPDVTPMPGTRSWLKGLANIRGNLLTIVDLSEFFGKPAVTKEIRSRILIMNTGEYSASLAKRCDNINNCEACSIYLD